jgi:hypothetical protein
LCTLRQTQIRVKEKLVVRTDIDVNGHERLFNITLRQTQVSRVYLHPCLLLLKLEFATDHPGSKNAL